MMFAKKKTDMPEKPRKAVPLISVCRGILAAIFVIIIGTVGIISLTDEDPEISEKENRQLKTYPEFSFSALIDGSFFRETEEAYNDTFPQRDFLVTASNSIKDAMKIKTGGGVLVQVNDATGGESILDEEYFEYLESQQEEQNVQETEEPEITAEPAEESPQPEARPLDWGEFSSEGYEQFENGMILDSILIDNNRFMQVFNGSIENAENYVKSMNDLRRIFPEQNIVSVMAPSSCAFYSEPAYRSDNHDQGAWTELTAQNMPGIICPDICGILEEHKDEYIYFKTDHHWTALGAYYAYCASMEALGCEPVDIDSLEMIDLGGFMGSLNNQYSSAWITDGPDNVYGWLPAVETKAVAHTDRSKLAPGKEIEVVGPVSYANKYASFIDGDHPYTAIETDAGTGRNALVIKNSFGDAFVPWLCNNYDNVYVIDPRHVNTTVWNELWPPEFFEYVDIDDIFVCFNTLMAGTSTLNQGMMMLTVPGAFEQYLRYYSAASRTPEDIRPGWKEANENTEQP